MIATAEPRTVRLGKVERELLAVLPGPNDSTGAFLDQIMADVFDSPMFSQPSGNGFDRAAAVMRAMERIEAELIHVCSQWHGKRRRVIEVVHRAREKIGDGGVVQTTKGYRLTLAAYSWVRANIGAREGVGA